LLIFVCASELIEPALTKKSVIQTDIAEKTSNAVAVLTNAVADLVNAVAVLSNAVGVLTLHSVFD